MKYAVELGRQQMARVLENGVRMQAKVTVHPKTWSANQWIGAKLCGRHVGQLELETESMIQQPWESLIHMYCQVELQLPDGDYFFDGHIVNVSQFDERWRITVAEPATILVQQRRRSHRSAVAHSSIVQITREQGEEILAHQGQLYNLSPEGIAFKLPAVEAGDLQPGQPWCVCFEIPEQEQFYKLQVQVRRILPSSNEGFVIVGMEFHPEGDETMQIEQLREFLEARRPMSRENREIMGELR